LSRHEQQTLGRAGSRRVSLGSGRSADAAIEPARRLPTAKGNEGDAGSPGLLFDTARFC
jgi:hypothetical protein